MKFKMNTNETSGTIERECIPFEAYKSDHFRSSLVLGNIHCVISLSPLHDIRYSLDDGLCININKQAWPKLENVADCYMKHNLKNYLPLHYQLKVEILEF